MVEGAALEMRCTRKGTVGSNPTLTALHVEMFAYCAIPLFSLYFLEAAALYRCRKRATLAQLVEQCFRKAKVPGTNPGGGSEKGKQI